VELTIADGEGTERIGERLQNAGVIDSAKQFEVLVSLMGFEHLMQAGDYELARGMTALEVIYRMREGVLSTRSVTVVEGWRLEEIADAVHQQGIPREDFIDAASNLDYPYAWVEELPRGSDLEGFLYPSTYAIRSSDTASSLVDRMLAAFDDNVPDGLADAAAQYGLTVPDVVTIASIIQREARFPEEKPVMAQVFLTRLRIGIPLEADPTVQYALAEDPDNVDEFGYWKAPLTTTDLEVDSLYNTYLNYGLPLGPIASPDAGTLLAVVQPAETNYLYFVARPDGSHAFAETLEEHIANVDKYQGAGE
jgi:UPF0755 protein